MNPYVSRTMIKQNRYFFGRKSELNQLFTFLAGMQSCSVVGPRRIGKSSLLYHVSRPEVYRKALPDGEQYIIAFLDLQELTDLGPEDFFKSALEKFEAAGQGRLEVDLEKEGTSSGFRRFLSRNTNEGYNLVLCCDEFEAISQKERFSNDFFANLRAFCSNYNLAMITSSRSSLYELCHLGNLQSSQFWNIFNERVLGPAPEAEARELIETPFKSAGYVLAEADIQALLDLTGCHPFFIQIACFYLYEMYETGEKAPSALESVAQKFRQDARPHFLYAWNQLNEADQATAAALAAGNLQALDEKCFERLKRQALAVGTFSAPKPLSASWQEFVLGIVPQSTGRKKESVHPKPHVPVEPTRTKPVDISGPVKETLSYLDFDLLIEKAGKGYRSRVINSPTGQATETFSLPFTEQDLEIFLLRIGRPRRSVRRVESPEINNVKTFGGKLFEMAFKGSVQTCLQSSLEEARRKGLGLRIKLRLADAPELADLPWEYLYNPYLNRFFSLSVESPIVRYLDLQEAVRAMKMSLPLNILAMISSPSDYPELDVECEWSNLKQALAPLEQSGLVQVDRLEQASLNCLMRQLRVKPYHIFHFVGHGGYNREEEDGVLVLEDDQGRGKQVSSQYLGTLLHDERSLRMAVLNACEGARSSRTDPFAGVAQSLIQQGIPAVVAMQFEITDEAAITFAREFYQAIADGVPVDAALSEARKMIYTQSDTEWGVPVLYMRSPDGRIFNLVSKDEAG